jgi:hypothetical protein
VEIGKGDLKEKNPKRVAGMSGADFELDPEDRPVLTLNFLNKKVIVTWPECGFSIKGSGEEVTIQEQILLLHYLNGARGSRVLGEWIAYQEVPDGKFYLDAFLRRAKNPMVQAFGNQPELLVKLAMSVYGAKPLDQGDFSVVVQALPMVPVALILWKGDEEFPPEGNILFDRSVSDILSAEDIAWLAGMIIYPLIGMAGNAGKK